MDGSPAKVVKTAGNLDQSGKFAHAKKHGARLQCSSTLIDIKFQVGPLQEVGVNGCSIEDVIDVCVERLRGFQAGPFACPENAEAIQDLVAAKDWLLLRTKKRQEQGVEGTTQPHVS